MRSLVSAIVVVAAACGASQPTAAPGPGPDTETNMRDHFSHTRATLPLIIAGNLPAARAKAAAIAMVRFDGELRSWGPFVKRMRSGAETLAGTDSLPMAARALADIAVECGQCHKSRGVEVSFKPVAEPPQQQTMQHHAWAAARMWEGLVGPSDALWNTGAAGLRGTTLHEPEPAPTVDSLIRSMASRVRSLGDKATDADNPIHRARVYGELLGTCSACHELSRR